MVMTNGYGPQLQPGEYLTPEQVAAILPGLTLNSLAVRRHRHQEPTFCRLGRTILYPREGIEKWVESSTVEARRHGR
ncbi:MULTISPECIES: helix-turn-helix domain-containing protein [Microbacterium]|jgi:hypothetical protein|uniref:DNA-binding protein n=1 Tax=Microbacterium wangchenii TaxID=2541726 RepID=A0ABX5SRH2_9MICO|nr:MULTISPECIES: helix-turn-helix domain-containing protein [Microbacterium]MCK6066514.1 helix-turn-helix domain-containing protein [Microbacterium sp. EYE_512]QBR87470.1 DNA-binding protein [Microbacterium wangchenii]